MGRPTDKSTKKWVQKCNFVFETIATVCDDGASNGCGWLIQLRLQDGEKVQCFINLDDDAKFDHVVNRAGIKL